LPPPPETNDTADFTNAEIRTDGTVNQAGPNPDPIDDCICYMSVTGISNGAFDAGTGTDEWYLGQDNLFFFLIQGEDDTWENGLGIFSPLPSDYSQLLPPSVGQMEFTMSYTEDVAGLDYNDFTIHTHTECYYQNSNGTETLGTTFSYDFVWSEGGSISGSPNKRFYKDFSCKPLPTDPPRQ